MFRQFIDWVPFQRPKISKRCPEHLKDSIYEQNKDFLDKWEAMTDEEVREAWLKPSRKHRRTQSE